MDNKPLKFIKHTYTKNKTGWGFSTHWKWLDEWLDYFYLLIYPPKFTKSNLEEIDIFNYKKGKLEDYNFFKIKK